MTENKLLSLFRWLILAGFILNSAAYSIYPSFPGRENGTCYRRVPYDDALKAAIAKGLVNILPGSEIASVKTSNSGWLTIIDCCDGFKKNNETLECEVHCDGGCAAGNCTGPNICTCEDGWRLEAGECKPICRNGCEENAYCFAPEVCSCEFGYQDVNGLCRPVCLHDCLNGDCLAPRLCRCHPGYYLNETKMCEPLCEGGCPHGYCQRPGICACDHGFIHPSDSRENCVAYCPDTCKNGICHSPGVCTCNEGYTRDSNDSCVPQCENGCTNGECVAPEQCRCNSGYIMNHQSKECVEYVNRVLHQNFTSYNKSNNRQNVHGQYGQREGYRPTESYTVPDRVIGLNDSRVTERPETVDRHEMSSIDRTYESQRTNTQQHIPVRTIYDSDRSGQLYNSRNQEHESQGIYTSQRRVPAETTHQVQERPNQEHNAQRPDTSIRYTYSPYRNQASNQLSNVHETRGSYRSYENSYAQEHERILTVNSHSSRERNISAERDRHWNSDSSETHRPQTNVIIEEVSMIPEAHIIITPHSVPRDNARPSSRPTYLLFPKPSEREGISVETARQNIAEATAAIKHPSISDNIYQPCNNNRENPELQWYDKTIIPQDRQHYVDPIDISASIKHHPACKIPCINGACVGINQCRCKFGYRTDPRNPNGNVCVPVCTGGCLNGVCTAPNLCICNAGFVKENGQAESQRCVATDYINMKFCVSIATFLILLTKLEGKSDHYEYAVSRNCTETYSTVTQVYLPYTEVYETRTWYGTKKWKTRLNYKYENRTNYHERAVCCSGYEEDAEMEDQCLPICANCGPREVCSKPETCQCSYGYVMDNVLKQCMPVCEYECLNGYCASPNSCLCNEGFSHDWNSETTCVPFCNNCSNVEHCAEPHVCQCNNGYTRFPIERSDLDEGAECKAVCDIECINADCVEPNICKCHEGYEKLNNDDFNCEPTCTYYCVNGECTNPNVCTCLSGYKLKANSSHICEPVCTKNCINAECIMPEICSCNDGYVTLGDENSNTCEPYCSAPCVHGRCSDPENCTCDPGYEFKIDKNLCEPTCTEACIMGNCTSPDTCTCVDNYRLKKGSKFECEPICKDECTHGHCVAPNECLCDDGYAKKNITDNNSKCVINCECDNGHCSDVESHCQSCLEGYSLFSTNYSTTCRPHCEGDCINGRCIEPELCICDESYILSNDTQGNTICIPLCSKECLHGACLREKGICDCLEGWSGVYCDEPLLCLIDIVKSDPVYAQLNE
ncbi:PREDICTED: multiple epidermal growth factor-like domains protein 10 [Ceratosolen solmsi marchali]|uniref:Multiple epidermal growth factor-like domains protein 10 n=1 Tax=Ceratosolen solmsi marchali TaxID=326594 RepID=A0AAJ6YHH5_9HYME|nr:PREDICTED: multiple epidermal growth factor-like domains protein 10 [Ceratosolen solmsi marchali]